MLRKADFRVTGIPTVVTIITIVVVAAPLVVVTTTGVVVCCRFWHKLKKLEAKVYYFSNKTLDPATPAMVLPIHENISIVVSSQLIQLPAIDCCTSYGGRSSGSC
jgi:hypothetical protein